MPRDLGGMATHVTQTTTTMAVCWKILTQAGVVLGFTSCSRDLVVDGVTYYANTGLEPTAVECNVGMQVNNSEVEGFLIPGLLTEQMVRAGFLDAAQVWKFVVNYFDPDSGKVRLQYGVLGEVQIKGQIKFTAEINGLAQWASATVVPLSQATCRANFGDAQCKKVPGTNNAAVTAVASQKQFTAAGLIAARADGFFDYGYVKWLTGNNAGLRMDVRHYDQATGVFTLLDDQVQAFAVGDTFQAVEGCAKTVAACKAKSNIINFDGEPNIPGNDAILHIIRAS